MGPETGPNQQDAELAAAQQAADQFCAPSDPFAPDQQMITAQMLGYPMPQGQQHTRQS